MNGDIWRDMGSILISQRGEFWEQHGRDFFPPRSLFFLRKRGKHSTGKGRIIKDKFWSVKVYYVMGFRPS